MSIIKTSHNIFDFFDELCQRTYMGTVSDRDSNESSTFQQEYFKEPKMKNLIAALVASLFAVSSFAASHTAAPGAPMADAKAAPMADAPVAKKAKKAKKHHHKAKKAMKAEAAAPVDAPVAK